VEAQLFTSNPHTFHILRHTNLGTTGQVSFTRQHNITIGSTAMEAPETFNQLPLTLDPTTKALSSSDPTLAADIDDLNKLHRALLSLDTPQQIPPPPAPVNPKRSVQITKLRESGNAAYKKGSFPEAITLYNLGIRMASDRPSWEASGLVREELSGLYGNRAQAYMAQQAWAEGAVDAECSVELKRVGNVKGWWRRGVCLKEMGRWEEAGEWVRSGLEYERAGPEKANIGELEALNREITKVVENS
jgi:translocation protein SEC72